MTGSRSSAAHEALLPDLHLKSFIATAASVSSQQAMGSQYSAKQTGPQPRVLKRPDVWIII